MKLKTSKYIIKESNVEKIVIRPEDYINYLRMVSGNGNLLKNVKKFKDKQIEIDGDLNLSNTTNITSLGPVNFIYGKLNITNSKITDIGDVKTSGGIIGGDYITLKSYYETGNTELLDELVRSSKIVDDYNVNESPLKTEIVLSMDDETFFKMCDLGDDDVWFLNVINSSYSDYNFYDRDNSTEDFKEGYLYHYFDDENIDKLIEILTIISPELNIKTKDNLVDNSQAVYEQLESFFSDELDDIINEYSYERDSATHKAVLEETNKEFTDIFSDYGLIEVRLFNNYEITVGNLLRLYEEYGENKSIYKLFKTIAGKEFSLPYFQELGYQITYDNDFDTDGFNRTVYTQLNSIFEKIEDGIIDNMVEYKEILNDIKKRYEFNKFYELPKDSQKPENERREFKITGVDLNTNEILVRVHDPKKGTYSTRYSLENFNLFLHHPELFENKKSKKILTENKLHQIALNWMNKHYGLDQLEVVTSEKYPNSIFYRKDGEVVMEQDKKNEYFWFHYDDIWLFFERFFNMEYQEIQGVLKVWLENTFKLEGYTPQKLRKPRFIVLENTFKLEGYTPIWR